MTTNHHPDATRRRGRQSGGGAPLTVAAVAARLGVAASTLRTWDRRYGLGPTSHEAGSHRRYSPEDVARLERMRHLTLQGVAPADAARAAMEDEAADHEADHDVGDDGGEEHAARMLVDPLSLAAAAIEPDPPRTQRMFAQEAQDRGIVRAWATVGAPAMEMLQRRERADRPGVDPQAVLTTAVLDVVRDVAHSRAWGRGPRSGTPVVLCPAPDRSLAAHVVGGGLAERGVASRVLRAGSAAAAPEGGTEGEGTHVLVALGSPPGAEELVRTASGRGLTVFLLGPGSPQLLLPGVHQVRTAAAAVEEIAELVRA